MSWLQGAGEAEEVVVAALVAAALVAGVLSGADQASYLLDLQIALYLTNYNCSTRGGTKAYTAKGNYFFFASSPISAASPFMACGGPWPRDSARSLARACSLYESLHTPVRDKPDFACNGPWLRSF